MTTLIDSTATTDKTLARRLLLAGAVAAVPRRRDRLDLGVGRPRRTVAI